MTKLEDLTPGASVKGILPDRLITVVAAKWIGTVAVELTHKDAAGNLVSLSASKPATLERPKTSQGLEGS